MNGNTWYLSVVGKCFEPSVLACLALPKEVAMHFFFLKNKRHVDGIDQETWLKDGSELESDGRRTNSQ
jgi:hypothetical protein